MALSDLTLLFGIQAREDVVEVFQKISGEIERVTGLFKDMGGTATEAGDLMSDAMSDPETTAGILQARMTELADSMEKLTIAEKEFKDATADASGVSDADADAMQRQVVAANEYEAALGRATAAQRIARTATEDNIAAQELANKSTEDSAGFLAAAGTGLNKIGPAAAIATAAIIGIGFEAAKGAAEYNQQVIAIANNSNISMKAAEKVGQAFLIMSTNSIYSASEIAQSYSQVGGQLSTLNGHALTAKQSVDFMSVAMKAAAASGQPLASVTASLAKIMQQLHIGIKGAAAAEADMYNVGRLTGQSAQNVTREITQLNGRLGVLAPSLKVTSALMLDMTEHGVVARQASTLLSTALNTLTKSSHLTVPTMGEMNTALKLLPPNVQKFGQAVLDGRLKVNAFTQDMKNLSGGDLKGTVFAGYLKSFESLAEQAKSSTDTINGLKLTPVQEELAHLNVSVFTAGGKYRGLESIFAQLGPKLADIKNKQQQLAIATLLLGSQAKALLPTILAGGAGYDKAAKAVDNQRAMTEASDRANNNYEADMKKVDHTIEMVRIELGNAFLPIMERVMKEVVNVVRPIAEWIEHNQKLAAKILVVVGGITGLITVLWAAHKVTSLVSNTFVNFGKDIQRAWTAGGKLISGIKDMITKMTGLKAANEESAGASDVATGSTEALSDVQIEAAGTTEALGDASLAAAPEIDAAGAPILAIVAAVALLVIGIYELIKHWKTVWDAIKDVATAVWDGLKTAWDDFWDFLKAAWDILLRVGKDIFHTLGIGILVMLGPIGLIIIAVKELVTHWTTIWHTILSVFDAVASGISKGVHDIISFFAGLPSKVFGEIEKLGSLLLNFGKTVMKDLVKGIVDGAEAIWNWFTALPGKIMGFIDTVLSDMLKFGEDIIKYIVKGIEKVGGEVGDAVKGILEKIPGVKGAMHIAGDVGHVAGAAVHDLNPMNWHSGGTIPGPVGTEVMAVLQAGESVFTRGQMSMLHKAVASPRFIMGTPNSGGTQVHVHVQGSVYGSLDKFAGELGRHLTGTLLPQAGVKLDH
jgi:hypothetical protein